MVVLRERPLRIEWEKELKINGEVRSPLVRRYGEMKALFLEEAEWGEDKALYYIYRKIHQEGEIRVDITVMKDEVVGRERNKTYGHSHPYPEIYQVLKGKVLFILQKERSDGAHDALLVDCSEGEVLIIPPNYGHVMVAKEEAITVNAVYAKAQNNYEEYKRKRGAAVYYLSDGNIVQNTNYLLGEVVRTGAERINRAVGFECKDLLEELYRSPESFAFLERPKILF